MDSCPHHEMIHNKCNQIDDLMIIVSDKVGLKSLIPIMAVVVAILGVFIGILHVGYRDTITEIREANRITTNLATTQGIKTGQDLTDIKVNMASLAKDVENIKNWEKTRNR
jgi:hypothetical protein